MQYSISEERLTEIVLCVIHCQLDENEAIDYAKSVLYEHNNIVEDESC